jgi:hypothetical protein
MKLGRTPEVSRIPEGGLDGGIAEWRTKGHLRFEAAFMCFLGVMRADAKRQNRNRRWR